ncbi:MAG TPA: dihydropteroate synthase, partial [Bacillota bacterium]|nr:dihydropteroate synthase [Bacillota bacterium]
MMDKFQHFTVRLFQLSYRQAVIIKQEMLARGAEAAVSYGVGKGDPAEAGLECEALLTGTWRQFQQFIVKLRMQPFQLNELASRLETALLNYQSPKLAPVTIQDRTYDLASRTYIMGIINLTPDSFSGDGLLTYDNYLERVISQAERMIS